MIQAPSAILVSLTHQVVGAQASLRLEDYSATSGPGML
jgi:hypothetical protein